MIYYQLEHEDDLSRVKESALGTKRALEDHISHKIKLFSFWDGGNFPLLFPIKTYEDMSVNEWYLFT